MRRAPAVYRSWTLRAERGTWLDLQDGRSEGQVCIRREGEFWDWSVGADGVGVEAAVGIAELQGRGGVAGGVSTVTARVTGIVTTTASATTAGTWRRHGSFCIGAASRQPQSERIACASGCSVCAIVARGGYGTGLCATSFIERRLEDRK